MILPSVSFSLSYRRLCVREIIRLAEVFLLIRFYEFIDFLKPEIIIWQNGKVRIGTIVTVRQHPSYYRSNHKRGSI